MSRMNFSFKEAVFGAKFATEILATSKMQEAYARAPIWNETK